LYWRATARSFSGLNHEEKRLNGNERIALGNTRLSVSRLCFGISALGDMPDTYNYVVDEERALSTIRAIFKSPVNFLDTSRIYGHGRSEQRTGRVIQELGGLPDDFVISTKIGRNWETNKFDTSQARRSLEESLQP
jgi:D-threo-aldose 1-dehydrogenase